MGLARTSGSRARRRLRHLPRGGEQQRPLLDLLAEHPEINKHLDRRAGETVRPGQLPRPVGRDGRKLACSPPSVPGRACSPRLERPGRACSPCTARPWTGWDNRNHESQTACRGRVERGRGLRGQRVPAQSPGLGRGRHLHEELGRRRRQRVLLVQRGLRRRGGRGRRDRHRDRARELRGRVQGPRLRRVPARVPGRPHAQPRRAVQRRDQVQGIPRSRHAAGRARRSQPVITRGSANARGSSNCSRAWTAPRTRAISCTASNQAQLAAKTLFPGGRAAQDRGAARRRGDRPAQREEEGFDRHLLHRRAALPRVPQPLHLQGAGAIKDEKGRVIGKHQGLSFYTLGQRQGLGIGGIKAQGREKSEATRDRASPGGGDYHAPWFVARKDMEKNTLWVVQGHEHPWLLSRALDADDASWVSGAAPAPGAYAAKTRYRQADAACTVRQRPVGRISTSASASRNGRCTPGQSAVLYDGEVCLGGGVISAND